MRHQKTRHKLSRTSAHRKALLANLCKELIQHERISTTEAKAKAVKPEVEQLITLAKRGDLHARRQALARWGRTSSRSTSCSRRSLRATRSGPAATRASSSSVRAQSTRPRWCTSSSSERAATAARARATRVRRDGLRGLGAPAGRRTVQGELERALARLVPEPVAADRRRAHRPRRPRVGPGRLVRGRAGDPSLNALLGRRRRGARLERGARRLRRARRRPLAHVLLPRAARRKRGVFERGRALWWPHRLDRAALDACAAAARGDARLHGLHADRDRPRPLLAGRARRRWGSAATSSSSGSRPRRSCAT